MIAALIALPIWALVLIGLSVLGLFALIEFERPGWATLVVALVLATIHFGTEVDVLSFVAHHPVQAIGMVLSYFVIGAAWSVGKWWFFVRRLRDKYDEQKTDFLRARDVLGDKVPEELKEAFLADVCPEAYHKAVRRFQANHPEMAEAAAQQRRENLRRDDPATGPDWEALGAWDKTFYQSRGMHSRMVLQSNLPGELKDEFRAILAGPEFKAAIIPHPRDHKARILIWMAWWPWSMIWTLLNDPIKRAFRAIYRWLQGYLRKVAIKAFRRVDDDLMSAPVSET